MADELDLDKLEALEKAATPRPWRMCEATHDRGIEKLMGPLDAVDDLDEAEWEPVLEHSAFSHKETERNWDLLAPLRNAASELIRRARRLERAEAALRAWDKFAAECELRNVEVPLWAALLNEEAVKLTRAVLEER